MPAIKIVNSYLDLRNVSHQPNDIFIVPCFENNSYEAFIFYDDIPTKLYRPNFLKAINNDDNNDDINDYVIDHQRRFIRYSFDINQTFEMSNELNFYEGELLFLSFQNNPIENGIYRFEKYIDHFYLTPSTSGTPVGMLNPDDISNIPIDSSYTNNNNNSCPLEANIIVRYNNNNYIVNEYFKLKVVYFDNQYSWCFIDGENNSITDFKIKFVDKCRIIHTALINQIYVSQNTLYLKIVLEKLLSDVNHENILEFYLSNDFLNDQISNVELIVDNSEAADTSSASNEAGTLNTNITLQSGRVTSNITNSQLMFNHVYLKIEKVIKRLQKSILIDRKLFAEQDAISVALIQETQQKLMRDKMGEVYNDQIDKLSKQILNDTANNFKY